MKLTMLTLNYSEQKLCPRLVKLAYSLTLYHTSTSVRDSIQNVPLTTTFPKPQHVPSQQFLLSPSNSFQQIS